MKRRPYQRNQRKPSGVMGVAFGLIGLVVILVAGYYILNYAHLMMVRTDLQTAVDSAALAGASSLYDTPEDMENAALSLAADNYVDGLPVSSSSPGTEVKLTAYAGDAIYPGCVKLTATREVELLGGGLCGTPETATVTATAVASTAGSVTTVNQDQLFPLAVSADAIPKEKALSGRPLTDHHLGDMMVLFVNSSSARNTAFTTFKSPSDDLDYLKAAIDQALKPDTAAGGLIPKLSVGDAIHLNNGNRGSRFLVAGDHACALTKHPLLTVPVIMGDPQAEDEATIVGFATFRVIGVVLSPRGHDIESLTVTLVKGMVHGISTPLPRTNQPSVDYALVELSAGIPKLVPPDYMDTKPWLLHGEALLDQAASQQENRPVTGDIQIAARSTDSVTANETSPDPQPAGSDEQPASDEAPVFTLPAFDLSTGSWAVDACLAVVLVIPLAAAMFYGFTRQTAYARSARRENPVSDRPGPYHRRWRTEAIYTGKPRTEAIYVGQPVRGASKGKVKVIAR